MALTPRSAVAALFVLIYGAAIWLDSSSLTAGAAGSADPSHRGATLALHSMLGYGGGAIGPLIIGWILDASSSNSEVTDLSWGFAFAAIGVFALLGRVIFIRLGPRALAGDR